MVFDMRLRPRLSRLQLKLLLRLPWAPVFATLAPLLL